VGIVMIKCPKTGRAIPTGIKADRERFRRSAVFFARTHCSICQTNHDWFAKEAWVCEPSVEGTRGSMCDLPQMMCWPYRNPETDAGAQ
jgi:hypothetical protein